jgi:hypothetical protein
MVAFTANEDCIFLRHVKKNIFLPELQRQRCIHISQFYVQNDWFSAKDCVVLYLFYSVLFEMGFFKLWHRIFNVVTLATVMMAFHSGVCIQEVTIQQEANAIIGK